MRVLLTKAYCAKKFRCKRKWLTINSLKGISTRTRVIIHKPKQISSQNLNDKIQEHDISGQEGNTVLEGNKGKILNEREEREKTQMRGCEKIRKTNPNPVTWTTE